MTAASERPSRESDPEFKQFRRVQIAELREYQYGEDLSRVSISPADKEAGSPFIGDMIARNPKNHADQWLVAAKYFADNFEPIANLRAPALSEGPTISNERLRDLMLTAWAELDEKRDRDDIVSLLRELLRLREGK